MNSILALVFLAASVVVPSPQVQHFLDQEVIAIIHFGLNTFADKEWGFGDTPASLFNPQHCDPEQWVKAAKAGGIRRIIMVCKHHDGFCLWPSKLNPDYTVANSPWKDGKGDLVREVRDAALRHGLEFAAYLSPWDRHRGDYGEPSYTKYFHDQWRDLVSNYGPITEIWLDGANGGDGWYGGKPGTRKLPGGADVYYDFKGLLKMIFDANEDAVVFGGIHCARQVTWPGNERGQVKENYKFIYDGFYCPPEADTPLRSTWFWHANDQAKSLGTLVTRYFESVGRGGVLDLGLAPNTDGLLDEGDVRRLKEFGDYIRDFNAHDFKKGCKAHRSEDGRVFTFKLPEPRTFNAVDIRENLAKGMRVAGWNVTADGVQVASGEKIANRRIVTFPDVKAQEIVFTITDCEGRPAIRNFALRYASPIEGEDRQQAAQYVSGRSSVMPATGMLRIDLAKEQEIAGFDYVPQKSFKGMVAGYTCEISTDGSKWTKVAEGEFGNLRANPVTQSVRFAGKMRCRYVRLRADKAIEGKPQWKPGQILIVK